MGTQRIIAIVGPTATGKTALGVELAKKLNGEVVSADSRQIYRGLDLGSGKVTASEAQGIPHHLIDVVEAGTTYSAHDYVQDATRAIDQILANHKTPIVVGGTGFYIDALLGKTVLSNVPPDQELRKELEKFTVAELQEKLKALDPERYKTIDVLNPRRLVRAIEIELADTAHKSAPKMEKAYIVTWIGLNLPLQKLKERICTRLISRLDAGMLDEARRLHENGVTYEWMDTIGLEYRYMARHLRRDIGYDEMVKLINDESAKYAKRQMTWFKRNKEIEWLEADSPTLLQQALALTA
jgi:tRNA dimethylallyltransferase